MKIAMALRPEMSLASAAVVIEALTLNMAQLAGASGSSHTNQPIN
ncbi:MAG: hypothetical protein ACI83P_002347 [Janthinobacterium sp.]